MATVILVRRARSTANGSGVLAGRAPKVALDDAGVKQAAGLVERFADVPVVAIVASPLLRCRQTVGPVAAAKGIQVVTDARLSEVDYGEWTGRKLSVLGKEPLWRGGDRESGGEGERGELGG